MVTKKLWNSFSKDTKKSILNKLGYDNMTSIYHDLTLPYNHDFEYDATGFELKKILNKLYKDASGQLKIVLMINPSYESQKPVKIPKNSPKNDKWIRYTKIVDDYEHSGDLIHEENHIKSICPQAKIIKSWEERDSEAEWDYENEYGELDEHIYQGYVQFEIPESYKEKFEDYGYYI